MTADQNGQVPEKDVWICTHSGVKFHPFAPKVSDINISDIAHALSNIGRYTGHTSSFYSVAQHSVLVSLAVPPEFAFAGLLHDASEAYLADLPRPMKPHFPKYKQWEAALEQVIATRYGLPHPMPPEVKAADLLMLRHEIASLFPPGSPLWERWGITKRPECPIVTMLPSQAWTTFMSRYADVAVGQAKQLRRTLG